MEERKHKFSIRLGLFIIVGIGLFIIAIFYIGRQKNLFDPVFKLTTTFKNVSGLTAGNNVRFSGINVGTVDNIRIINDTTVQVQMSIKKNVQQFIKTDSEAAIGSSGIIGDRIVVISQGSNDVSAVKDGQNIGSREPVETDAIISSLQTTADNAAIISDQLAEIMIKVNSGDGILGRLIQDTAIAENVHLTIENLKKTSKNLNEDAKAVQHNFLLKGYFKKKEREAEKKKKEEERKKRRVERKERNKSK